MKYIYLDTCSINYLHDNLIDDEKEKWRKMIEEQFGGSLVFSPVSLFEILNSSTERKDDLIHTCQLLFDTRLLPMPTDILDAYIEKGCPLVEKSNFNLYSDNLVSEVWRDVSNNLDKTIIVDKINNLNDWSKILKNFIKEPSYNPNNNYDKFESAIRLFIEEISPLLEIQNEFERVSLFFIAAILLLGVLPFDSPDEFWKKRNISCMECKMEYLVKNCQALVHRGPIAAMAMMAVNQVKNGKSSRGLFVDCLHIGYAAYCSIIISNDNHFMEVSDVLKEHINCEFVSIKMKDAP